MLEKLKVPGLVAFAAVDIVLVAVLIQHARADRYHPGDAPLATSAASPSDEPTVSALKPTGSTGLVMAANGSILQITRGSCTDNGTPLIEQYDKDIKAFREIGLPITKAPDNAVPGSRAEAVKTILQIKVTSPTEFSVVGSDDSCKAHAYTTKDGGGSWSTATSTSTWYINASGTEVVSPTQASQPGCDVLSLSSPFADRNAKVACKDGSIRGTDDGGATWVSLGTLTGVNSASFIDIRRGFAVADTPDCRSRAYFTLNAGLAWTAAGCIGKEPSNSIVATSSRRIAVLMGSKILMSEDNGLTWTSL